MTSYVPPDVRAQVAERARYLCEYCLIAESDTAVGCQVDHVISEKHGGSTELPNLAYACAYCNRFKGSDVGSVTEGDRQFVRLFDPRTDHWGDHFQLSGVRIVGRTVYGEVTVKLLRMNLPERLMERTALIAAGAYPPDEAANLVRVSNETA